MVVRIDSPKLDAVDLPVYRLNDNKYYYIVEAECDVKTESVGVVQTIESSLYIKTDTHELVFRTENEHDEDEEPEYNMEKITELHSFKFKAMQYRIGCSVLSEQELVEFFIPYLI